MIYQKGTPEQKASFMNRLFWLGLFIALFLLCACFVSTHDDYYIPEMGNSFTGSLEYAATMGNGRYIGNFLGNYLAQRTVANTIVKSLMLWLIVRLSAAFFRNRKELQILAGVLILWPGSGIFAQGYNWSHGFYNYVAPVVFLLAELKLTEYSDKNKWACIGAMLCGFSAMLFSENTAIICLLITGTLTGWKMWKYPGTRKRDTLILIASLIGAAVMFFLPKLTGVSEKIDWYRGTVSFGDFSALISNVTDNAVYIMRTVSEWHLFWGALLILLGLQVFVNKKASAAAMILLMVFAGAMIVIHACLKEDEIPHMTAVFFALFAASLALTVWIVCKSFSKTTLKRVAWPFLFALLSAGELLVVFPIGPRCMYITYILMMFCLLILWEEKLEEFSNKGKAQFRVGFTCILCAAWLVLLIEMIPLHQLDCTRIEYIKEQLDDGKTEIEVIALPENGLLYWPNNCEQMGYTFNNGDPGSMTFTVISVG